MAREIKTPRGRVFINTKTMKAELEWNENFGYEQNKKYGKGSPLQKRIDEKAIKGMRPYLPFKSGFLTESAELLTEIGSGVIVYRPVSETGFPYAPRLYYNPGFKFDRTVNPLAGAYWDRRWWADNHTAFIADLQRFVGG